MEIQAMSRWEPPQKYQKYLRMVYQISRKTYSNRHTSALHPETSLLPGERYGILVQNLLHLAGLKETLPKDLRVYIAKEISKVRPQNYRRDEHIIWQIASLQKTDFKERNNTTHVETFKETTIKPLEAPTKEDLEKQMK